MLIFIVDFQHTRIFTTTTRSGNQGHTHAHTLTPKRWQKPHTRTHTLESNKGHRHAHTPTLEDRRSRVNQPTGVGAVGCFSVRFSWRRLGAVGQWLGLVRSCRAVLLAHRLDSYPPSFRGNRPWPRVHPGILRGVRAAAGLSVSGARRPRGSPGRGSSRAAVDFRLPLVS